jgi:hypothetical protein
MQVCQKRNSTAPTNHELLLQGKETLYMIHIPTFSVANHRQQLISKISIDERSKQKYLELKDMNLDQSLYLFTEAVQLPKILNPGDTFKASIRTKES